MRNNRILYFLLCISIIALGILSRKTEIIPLFVGDILYSIMIYFLIRFLFLKIKLQKTAFISLLVCYAIETLQLYQADWINEIRHTVLGRLVLGQGFLWSDLLAYTFGITIALLGDMYLIQKKKS